MLQKSIKQHITKLHQKKYRTEFGEFLVEGLKGVDEAIDAGAGVVLIIVDGSKRDEAAFAALIEKAEQEDIEVVYCGRKDIGEIKTTDTYPGITAVVDQPESDADDIMDGSPVLCLDGVSDPGNLGTIIRTADWFGIKHVLLGEGTVDPYNDKVVRSTMGSMFRTHIVKTERLVDTLDMFKENGYHLASFEMTGTDFHTMSHDPKTVYIFGSESHGVRPEVSSLADVYTIPGSGNAESLNVAMAAGIVMSNI